MNWSIAERIERHLVLSTLDMTRTGREPPALYYSDRDNLHDSEDYRTRLAQRGITCSMSRKGNYWDSAVAKSFFSTLMMEFVHDADCATRDQARSVLVEHIEVF